MVRALGLDLGETLIYFHGVPLSWQHLYREALCAAAGRCGVTVTDQRLDEAGETLTRFNGRLYPRVEEVTTDAVWSPILTVLGIAHEHLDTVVAEFFDTFLSRRFLYPDTLPFLQELAARNLPFGILSDVPYGMPRTVAARMLEGIEAYCPIWLTSVEAGYCKPDPRGLLALAERLDVPPAEMAYVGNEEKDILAAQTAGMLPVRLDRDDILPDPDDHVRITRLTHLFSLLP